jgi:hypothetical protein
MDEAEKILRLVGGVAHSAFDVVERQLAVLVLRTQVMLSLSGIVITVTGFSGRTIAQTSAVARILVATGILIVLASAATAIGGVLRLRWLTQSIDDDALTMVRRMIGERDRKARFLGVSLVLFIGGFACYCVAIALMLLAARPSG